MIKIKTPEEIEIMAEGGKKLAQIKNELRKMILPGAIPQDLDKKAEDLVHDLGGEPSFKMVKNYHWTTCININDGVVHGIPTKLPFRNGDIVKVDVGIFYKGFHNDSAFSAPVGEIPEKTKDFLDAGKEALKKSIAQAQVGNNIAQISKAMEESLTARGYTPVQDLTGHGAGRNLHEDPQIPCFWEGPVEVSPEIPEGAVLAIEVIYVQGENDLILSGEDGWTISTRDGKIAALFEETIVPIKNGPPRILTA